jgi:hypothetical protein
MGSSSSTKPRGKPPKLLRVGGADEATGGASTAGTAASRSPRRASAALQLERVERSIAAKVQEGHQVGLADDGRDIPVKWQRQTLGFIRRSDLIRVRNMGSNAATISKVQRPAKIWILLA